MKFDQNVSLENANQNLNKLQTHSHGKNFKTGLNPFSAETKYCICVYKGLIHSQGLVSTLIMAQFLGNKVILTKLLTVAETEYL